MEKAIETFILKDFAALSRQRGLKMQILTYQVSYAISHHGIRRISFFFFFKRTQPVPFPPASRSWNPQEGREKKPSRMSGVHSSVMKITDLMWGKINARALPLSMLIPLLRRSRRHLVASIHPSSLSQHPALSLGSGHALSPPLHAREQHHHYCKWQLAGGDGREGCGERPALNLTSWCWMGITDHSHPH